LHDEKDAGRFRFIFQPSEENNFNDDEGWSGAKRMVSEGALDGVDVTIGLHQRPDLPSGTLGLQSGTVMASADMFELIVHGKSSHAGAAPEKGIDAIVIASDWVQSLQTIISRRISPRSTGVISVGTIDGGQIANIIADRVRMTGTIRSRDAETRATILREVETLNRSLEQRYSAKLRWEVLQEVPLTHNSIAISSTITNAVKKELPMISILTDVDMMAAEDFSYYGMNSQAFFGFLGTGLPDGPAAYGLHHPKMDLDEDAMLVGVQFFVTAARALQKDLSTAM
jgi:amidohydrolase